MTIDTVFHSQEGLIEFEDFKSSNGLTFWLASQFMVMLGYQGMHNFRNVINKAISVCTRLNIPIEENFIPTKTVEVSREFADYKISRFACYLIAMNSDSKKIEVARAQAFFAAMADMVCEYASESESFERLYTRGEITEHERSLSGIVHRQNVANYALFQNAGYRGLYNMDLRRLKDLKHIPDNRSPLDFMGSEELAANLFRITQTEAKIRQNNIRGQQSLELAAESVGTEVRKTMIKISNTRPEELPIHEDIRKVTKEVKQLGKGLKKIDKKK
jgi:DNA-damage-inducible protein D